MYHNILRVALVIVSVVGLIFALNENFSQKDTMGFSSPSINAIKHEISLLEHKLEGKIERYLFDSLASSSSKGVDNTELHIELKRTLERVELVEQQTIALRQAINPVKPDEILQIARLTDEIVHLKKNMNNLEKSLLRQQEMFQASVIREIKSSNDSTSLILVVLLPLVLNFIYAVWKDFQVKQKKAENP